MTMPAWWNERRFGLFVHTTVATVPAWAPIGEYAEWYRSHLGQDLADAFLHPHTMVEVLAHHRDRWGHVEHYDDFVELLGFENFDAEEWAALARDAGAGYTVLVTKHHDGWAWWDAPGSTGRLTEHGPRRDVVGEYAAACERNDLAFGTYYSLLDWRDPRYPGRQYVDEALHPHVLDLVERYGSTYLWGDGHWGHGADTWRTAELLERARSITPDLVINDRWCASHADVPEGAPQLVRTFEYDPPDPITRGPWELTRGLGHSFGHNRAELASDHMTGAEIVDLFTEVIAKGGHLLLNVGPAADGTIPPEQSGPLRDAGTWIRHHHDLLARSVPWTAWGDSKVRYMEDPDGSLIAVDIGGAGIFSELGSSAHLVVSVERVGLDGVSPVGFVQEAGRLVVDRSEPGAVGDVPFAVYRIDRVDAVVPDGLFISAPTVPIPLGPLLDGAQPGSIVQLSDGVYLGPVTVPPGVTLRGLGVDRTSIQLASPRVTSNQARPAPVSLGAGAHLEHLCVVGPNVRSDWSSPPVVTIPGNRAGVLGCRIEGGLHITGHDVLVRATDAQGLRAVAADRLHVSRCHFTGNRWDVGVELNGGDGHVVESNEFDAHLCSIRMADTTGSSVRGNTVSGRWWGVHADHTQHTHLHGNRFRSTMRAVDIDGGSHAVVDGNSVSDGDSGCLIENGAADCEVSGNHWERCRVGLITWGAVNLHHQHNVASGLRDSEGAHITGP